MTMMAFSRYSPLRSGVCCYDLLYECMKFFFLQIVYIFTLKQAQKHTIAPVMYYSLNVL